MALRHHDFGVVCTIMYSGLWPVSVAPHNQKAESSISMGHGTFYPCSGWSEQFLVKTQDTADACLKEPPAEAVNRNRSHPSCYLSMLSQDEKDVCRCGSFSSLANLV